MSLAVSSYCFCYHYHLLKVCICLQNDTRLYWEIGIFDSFLWRNDRLTAYHYSVLTKHSRNVLKTHAWAYDHLDVICTTSAMVLQSYYIICKC